VPGERVAVVIERRGATASVNARLGSAGTTRFIEAGVINPRPPLFPPENSA
jgi:hypothetical protein